MTQKLIPADSNCESLDSVCTVRLGGELFAVRLKEIVEVMTGAQVYDCPLAPAHIAGLMHYRGDVLTVVHLRALLGLPASIEAGNQSVSMVMAGTHGLFALQVDGIGEVRSLDASWLEAVPTTSEAERRPMLRGIYKLDHGLLPLLDVQRLEPVALRAWTAAHVHDASAAAQPELRAAMAL
jgi:purine-binding chemotaxis protein CheW